MDRTEEETKDRDLVRPLLLANYRKSISWNKQLKQLAIIQVLSLETLDADDNVLLSKTVENVPFKRNRVTIMMRDKRKREKTPPLTPPLEGAGNTEGEDPALEQAGNNPSDNPSVDSNSCNSSDLCSQTRPEAEVCDISAIGEAMLFVNWAHYFDRLQNQQVQMPRIEECCPTLYAVMTGDDADLLSLRGRMGWMRFGTEIVSQGCGSLRSTQMQQKPFAVENFVRKNVVN